MTTRLYYEAHITVEASNDVAFETFAAKARAMGWRASKFDEDEVDDMNGNWFLSFRDPSLTVTKRFIKEQLVCLRCNGLIPIRWKIEDTVLDSKHGDTELALEGAQS
jgi:hypothetical protein